jgi:hypothetical protein
MFSGKMEDGFSQCGEKLERRTDFRRRHENKLFKDESMLRRYDDDVWRRRLATTFGDDVWRHLATTFGNDTPNDVLRHLATTLGNINKFRHLTAIICKM